MPNDYRGNNDGMDNLMAALGRLQQSNQNTQENQLKQLLQQRQLQGESDRQQADFGQQQKMAGVNEGYKEQELQKSSDIKQAEESADLKRAQDAQRNQPQTPYGGKAGVRTGTAEVSSTMPNTYQIEDRANGEFGKAVRTDKTYQTIHDRIDSANNALTQLQQGNAFSDKMAMLPEIRAVMGSQGVSRVFQQFQSTVGSSGASVENFFNWLGNKADPTIQQNVRNAMTESIMANANNYMRQYQTYKQAASQKAQQTHGIMNPGATVNNTFIGDDNLVGDLTDKMNTYAKQKAQNAQAQGSNPSAVTPNNHPTSTLGNVWNGVKSTVGGLSSLLGGGQQPAQPQQTGDFKSDPGFQAWKAKRDAGQL